jgi:hypothetical protein
VEFSTCRGRRGVPIGGGAGAVRAEGPRARMLPSPYVTEQAAPACRASQGVYGEFGALSCARGAHGYRERDGGGELRDEVAPGGEGRGHSTFSGEVSHRASRARASAGASVEWCAVSGKHSVASATFHSKFNVRYRR